MPNSVPFYATEQRTGLRIVQPASSETEVRGNLRVINPGQRINHEQLPAAQVRDLLTRSTVDNVAQFPNQSPEMPAQNTEAGLSLLAEQEAIAARQAAETVTIDPMQSMQASLEAKVDGRQQVSEQLPNNVVPVSKAPSFGNKLKHHVPSIFNSGKTNTNSFHSLHLGRAEAKEQIASSTPSTELYQVVEAPSQPDNISELPSSGPQSNQEATAA